MPKMTPPLSARRWCRAAAMIGLTLLAGCGHSPPYRTSAEACTVTAPQPVKEAGGKGFDWELQADGSRPCGNRWQVSVAKPVPFSMNFVEIDEQGMLVDRAQAEAALAHAARREPGGSYVVVFIHGWHHNAGTGDSNVNGFYDALALVSRWNPGREVKGIYIGWRGASVPLPGLKYLTFWERKNTSDEVGRGSLLEFMLRLERGVKPKDGGQDNRLVAIGHSFGASVMFNALAHVTMERFLQGVYADAGQAGPRFRAYGDLVVLVNPAIEAMRFMPLQSAMHHYAAPGPGGGPPLLDFSRETRPAVLILSSEGDWATHTAFPTARFFSNALQQHGRLTTDGKLVYEGKDTYSEWVLDRDTVANVKEFHTHLTLQLTVPSPVADPEQGLFAQRCTMLSAADVWSRLYAPGGAAAVFPDSGITVQRRPKALAPPNSPYIVAPVSTDIIAGHSSIGGPSLVCFINQLADTQDAGVRELIVLGPPPKDPADLVGPDGAP
jgi:hypothetical protein